MLCVMNVAAETCWSKIACSVPLCDWSGQVIDCPKEIWSSNSCQVQAFQYHLRASPWKLSDNFRTLWFYLVVVQRKCGHFMKLVTCLLSQFAKAFNTVLSWTLHVAASSCDVFGKFHIGFDICACDDQLREQFLLLHCNYVTYLCCPLSTSKIFLIT